MWTLVRALVVALALAALVGQSNARATAPQHEASASPTMADCQSADRTAGHDPAGPDQSCPDTDPACAAKTGCSVPVPPPPVGVRTPAPVLTVVRLQAEPERALDDAQPDRILRPPRNRL